MVDSSFGIVEELDCSSGVDSPHSGLGEISVRVGVGSLSTNKEASFDPFLHYFLPRYLHRPSVHGR